ncbi:hypothetical protein BC826DRAFT_738816 [Russula brevipes]|nr:hypothetical protein BC826DRAFT_738816 [Russula brevipes]
MRHVLFFSRILPCLCGTRGPSKKNVDGRKFTRKQGNGMSYESYSTGKPSGSVQRSRIRYDAFGLSNSYTAAVAAVFVESSSMSAAPRGTDTYCLLMIPYQENLGGKRESPSPLKIGLSIKSDHVKMHWMCSVHDPAGVELIIYEEYAPVATEGPF